MASQLIKADITIIGAGSAGLSVAAGAAQMGANVVLIEKGKMGGDCLNYGCVPSKALLAAAASAQTARTGARFGVNSAPEIDFAQVNRHVHGVIAAIAPHDSVERFEGLGVQVIQAAAQFTAPGEVQAGGYSIQSRRFVIASGSAAGVPPIPGIEQVPVYTNENIFELSQAPQHLIVIGGGPIGLEMAQAHRRLGCRVTVLEGLSILNKDDPEAVAVVRTRIQNEGIELHEGIRIARIEARGGGIGVMMEDKSAIEGSHLLVAAGRKPNVDGMALELAGVEYSARGIPVDQRLRTSSRHIFAIGDVIGGYQFTHMAGYHAGIVIRNALFKLPAKVKYDALPWVTFTDPELAHVGLQETQAKERYGDVIRVLKWSFAENDRAQTEQATAGLIKAVIGRRGKILGATIVGRHAGELITPWVLAIDQGLKIGAMANVIVPYPTLSEVSKRVAGSYYTEALFGPRTRKIVRFLQRFG